MAFMTPNQINAMGFKSVGKNVLLSDKSSFYNCKNISIGDNVRIDDFCVISAGVDGMEIGNFVHIAVYVSLIGSAKISIQDYAGISSRVSVYSSNDDYSGTYMTNPMVPQQFTNVKSADVFIGKHVIIGSGSVILPGVKLHEGVAIGALSLVSRDCEPFGVYLGQPARKVKERNKDLLGMESQLKESIGCSGSN